MGHRDPITPLWGDSGVPRFPLTPISCPYPPTAVKNSAKGSHRDKRTQIVYNEDLFGEQ